jgi:hypothetical protein
MFRLYAGMATNKIDWPRMLFYFAHRAQEFEQENNVEVLSA